MLIEGRNAVREALKSNITINKLLFDKSLEKRKDELVNLAFEKKIKIEFLPKAVLDKRSKTSHHQGYIAEVVDFEYCSIDDILQMAKQKNEKNFIVILDGIEDPHNFGAIIRSCECAGVHGIIIGKNRCAQVNETVIKTSTGAIANMQIARVANIKDAITYLKERDVWVFGAEIGGENIYKQNLDRNIAIVIGSEGNGIRPLVKSYCDGIITLPLKGKVNSLNASVACGIVVFETLRQREEVKNGK